MSEREKSLNKIKRAYDNLELGFQRGAVYCKYYDAETDSKCAVGALFSKEEILSVNINGYYCNNDLASSNVSSQVDYKPFKGLTVTELETLQQNHDLLISDNLLSDIWFEHLENFEQYLFSLK